MYKLGRVDFGRIMFEHVFLFQGDPVSNKTFLQTTFRMAEVEIVWEILDEVEV